MDLKDKPTEELIRRYKALHQAIHITECFGSRDVIEFYQIEAELIRRGYKIIEDVRIEKEES